MAPTNEQVHSLVARVKQLNPDLPVAFVHAHGRDLPAAIAALPGVTQPSAADAQTHGDQLVIATVDKLADAFLRDGLGGFDVLVIDEAFQADAARYYTAAGVAPTHLLVGDTGQLDPFSPIDDATFWRGGPEDPLQTAVGVLLRNHPSTVVHRIPITWRLDPRAVPSPGAFIPRTLSARPSGQAFANSGSPAPARAASPSRPLTTRWTRRRRTGGRTSHSPARRS